MHDDIALSDLSSCRTRQIRAKLKRRVHWLCCVCFHIHNMPMSVRFFKPPLTSFHQLVGFYLPYWHPAIPMIKGRETCVKRNLAEQGVHTVSDLFTKRNLWALAAILEACKDS